MRRNLSTRCGNCFHSCAELECLESWGSTWTVLSLLWPLSIPIYHFPQCLWCFLPVPGGLSQKVILPVYSKTLLQHAVTHLTYLWADGDHSHSASHSHTVAEMLDLPLEQVLEPLKSAAGRGSALNQHTGRSWSRTQLSTRHWAIGSVCLLSRERSVTHCRKTWEMVVNWDENTASRRAKMVIVKITPWNRFVFSCFFLPILILFFVPFSFLVYCCFLLPCEQTSCTQVSYRCNSFHGSLGLLSLCQRPSGDGWGCHCWQQFTSAISALRWEICTFTTSVQCQLSYTLTTVILPPSTLQNKRVGINLAAVRLLYVLQSQLPWGTFTGCSPENQTLVGQPALWLVQELWTGDLCY